MLINFTPSTLAGLLLSATVSGAAISSPQDVIVRRQAAISSSELQFEEFNVEVLNVANPNHELYDCDPDTDESCAPVVHTDETTGTYNICPPDQSYQKSECMTGSLLKVYCKDGNGRVWPKWLRCERTEICIQNSLEPPYARCKPVVDLVLWYTNTAGGSSTSTKYVHAVNKRAKTKVGNMYYDNNKNLVKLFDTDFFHEPGNQDLGETKNANRAYSSEVDWANTENVKINIETGGSGGIAVYTFLL